jgi:superfamily II DNA or RNA helicase
MRKEYQFDALEGVVADWDAGFTDTALIMPTGTGKTITAGMASKYFMEEYQPGGKTLFIAHRHELIEQAEACFTHAFGFTTAIERGQESEREYKRLTGQEPEVVVATIQSLYEERLMERFPQNRFGLIITDECHRATAKSYTDVFAHFHRAKKLGITATPDTENKKKNLGDIFTKISYQLRMDTAVRNGDLCRVLLKTIPIEVDLSDIRTTGGDFNMGDVAERVGPALESICSQVKHYLKTRKCVMFTPDTGSANAAAEMLRLMGVKAQYVAGEGGKNGMSREARKETLKAFKADEFQVIVCCDLLVEGWDMPSVSMVVIARPTKKLYKFIQMAGRGTRLCPEIGKTDCLVLDLDWKTDRSSRNLVRTYSLCGSGDIDDVVLDALQREFKSNSRNKNAAPIDLFERLEALRKDPYTASKILVSYTGKHSKVFDAIDSDPLGVGRVLDIHFKKRHDFDMSGGGPVSPYVAEKLRSLGVKNSEKMSVWGASKLLGKLESRQKKGLASHQQVKTLLGFGVDEVQAREMSVKQASSVIAENILKQQEMF